MITLLLALNIAQASTGNTTTVQAAEKPRPNYIIDGQALSQMDAIKYAIREPGAEIWKCQQVVLIESRGSVRLAPKK